MSTSASMPQTAELAHESALIQQGANPDYVPYPIATSHGEAPVWSQLIMSNHVYMVPGVVKPRLHRDVQLPITLDLLRQRYLKNTIGSITRLSQSEALTPRRVFEAAAEIDDFCAETDHNELTAQMPFLSLGVFNVQATMHGAHSMVWLSQSFVDGLARRSPGYYDDASHVRQQAYASAMLWVTGLLFPKEVVHPANNAVLFT